MPQALLPGCSNRRRPWFPPVFQLRDQIRPLCPQLRHVFADGGYAGDALRDAMAPLGRWTLEIIKRSDAAKGFEFLPRRWVVECTVA